MSTPYRICDGKFQRERSGLVHVSPVWLVPGPTADGDAEPYAILDGYEPDEKPLGLPEVDRDAAKRPDGDWDLTIHFEGAVSDKALNPILEYDIAKVEDPIATSDRFEKLKENFGGKIVTNDDGAPEFKGFAYKIKDPATGQMIKNPLFGTTHFRNNAPRLSVEFGLKDFRADILRDINRIVTPQVPEGQAGAIETPDGKNWLKSSVKASFRGNIWLIHIEYELGIWAQALYSADAP